MTNASRQNRKAAIDPVGWLFIGFAAAVTVVAVLIAYSGQQDLVIATVTDRTLTTVFNH